MAAAADLINLIIQHEGLAPGQTPFRISSPAMANWTSMFDDTIKTQLDPKAVKPKGRENFLYLKNKDDLRPAVEEQFRRYKKRNPEITVEDAIQLFDQTGAAGKSKFLNKSGIDTKKKLSDYISMNGIEELTKEMERQLT